jgi:hypothetical protein
MDKWIDFFKQYFPDMQAVEHFVNKCESLTPSDSNHKAKIMLHQTQRLISIADDLPTLRPKRESLQLLFLIVCAEHISKLHYGFKGEGQSRKYVKRFFDNSFYSPRKTILETVSLPVIQLQWLQLE